MFSRYSILGEAGKDLHWATLYDMVASQCNFTSNTKIKTLIGTLTNLAKLLLQADLGKSMPELIKMCHMRIAVNQNDKDLKIHDKKAMHAVKFLQN